MVRLNMSFFGTFQVTLDQQPITHFRSANNQGLLVYLALQNDKPISREQLTALFWPDESDQTARNNLRQSLYRLRNLLGDGEETAHPYLLVTRQTVQFNPDSDFALDVQQFLQAVDNRELETAVSLYLGDLLPGFTCDSLEFEAWLRQERETLHNLALEALTEVTRDHLQNGRYAQAQATARQQLSLEPWREQAHRQLMQAFALSGDRGNALAQYDTLCDVLEEEFGVEPAPETQSLFEQIQAGRYGSVILAEPLRPPVRVKHNLPADTTPFVGRELELTQISHLLTQDNQRLVTIVGPGGMGKTRLALAAGGELLGVYPDGVYLVDLAPLSHPEEILPAIAATLDYQSPDKAQNVLPQLITAIGQRQLLLIMDNIEHLLAGATLINDMLQACPQVAFLVTSRQRLNLASESRYDLGGLEFPDSLTREEAESYAAVQLFVEYGRRAQPDFVLTQENVPSVVRICQLVQGMPLGLVLASAWLAMLTPAEIAMEIADCLDFLAADLADLPPRQRSMQAVFDRSWRLMLPEEQAVMARLSVFRGGFSREAAEQVAGANLRLLLSLVNKSLLRRQAENGRFMIHELLRQFAAIKHKNMENSQTDKLTHMRYFSQLLADETERSVNMYPLHIYRQHMADKDNIRQAWEYALEKGLVEELAKMARGISIFSFAQGMRPTVLMQQALDSLNQRGLAGKNRALFYLRMVQLNTRSEFDDNDTIRLNFLKFIAELEAWGDMELLYWGYDCMAFIEIDVDMSNALRWHEKAYVVASQLKAEHLTKRTQALTLWFCIDSGYGIDKSLAQLRDLPNDTVLKELEDLLKYFERGFSSSYIVYSLLLSLCVYCFTNEENEKALFYGKRGLNIAKDWQDLYWISFAADRIGYIYTKMGLRDQAVFHLLDALDWHLAIGQTWKTLGNLWSLVLKHAKLFRSSETIVLILSMVFHHSEATDFYKQEIGNARTQFEGEMGADTFAAAWEAGKGLDMETAVSHVRAALTSGETR